MSNRIVYHKRLPEGPTKAEAQQRSQWAKYYADQSSAAAHHYHNNPHAGPPAQLPPAPPTQQTPQQPVATTQLNHVQKVHNQQPQKPQESPDGMKRYVHKCLARCANKDQMQVMQKEVEHVIASAIRSGTMHTTNWDAKELLPVPGVETGTAAAVVTSGTAAAVRKYQHGNTAVAINGTAAAVQNVQGHHVQTQVGTNQYGQSSTETSYYGPDTRAPSNHYGPSSDADYSGSAVKETYKNKWQRTDRYESAVSDNSSYYGSPSNHYYGNSKDLGDFVSVPKSSSKKRKKSDNAKGGKVKDGFERSTSALSKRANRFSEFSTAIIPTTTESDMKKYMGLALIGGSKKLKEADYEHMKVKGTCQTLEKEYLRLTAPPRAELVRPQPVLRKHLENLKAEWATPKHRDYTWFCSQLKAIRQDLTVQQIVTAFAVDVYETHARIALEEADLNEYNQCQTQLKELYETLRDNDEATKNRNEFVAYRLIYYIFLTGNKKYQGGSSDLFKIMLSLTPEQREDPCISHALKVRVAVADFDYHAFFRLKESCPKHGVFMMDFMVPKVRHWALQRICKAYRPSVSSKYVLEELGFDLTHELEYGNKWLESCGCVLSNDDLLTKDSVVRESDLTDKSSSLI